MVWSLFDLTFTNDSLVLRKEQVFFKLLIIEGILICDDNDYPETGRGPVCIDIWRFRKTGDRSEKQLTRILSEYPNKLTVV